MNYSDWRSLSPHELDWAYDQTQHASNMREVLDRCAQQSAAVWKHSSPPQTQAYGPAPIETLHWYRSHAPKAPVVFFIHGGAWRSGRAQDYAFGVPWLLAMGVDVVIPDFSSVLDTQGQLMPMAVQLQHALAHVVHHSEPMQTDASRIYVCAHSSGAHLAACLPTLNWQHMAGGRAPVAGLLCCSGLFDLEPVRHSSRSQYVRFDDAVVHQLSPVRHITAFDMPVTVLCGTRESPEFMRQSAAFDAALAAHGVAHRLVWGQGLNHFEMLASQASAQGVMGQALAQLIMG